MCPAVFEKLQLKAPTGILFRARPAPAAARDISPFIATALVAQIVRNCNRHPLTAFDPREDSPWQFSVESPALLADGLISRPG